MRLAILGASGHDKVVADIALLIGYSDVVFYDDTLSTKSVFGRWPVIGTTETLLDSITDFDAAIVGIGDNRIRLEKHILLANSGAPLVTLVHPAAIVSDLSQIGIGTVICAGAVVCVDSTLGSGVIVNTNATVDHDCHLADGVHIAPGTNLSGDVHVGENSWIGVGACVKQGISIGSGVMVGAGSVVVSDIPDNMTVVGNPARPIMGK